MEPPEKKTYIALIVPALIIAFLGLFNHKAAPACGDQATKNMVISLAKDKIRETFNNISLLRTGHKESDAQWKQDQARMTISVENIRTESFDKQTGKYECAADLVINGDGAEVEKRPITYSSELISGKSGQFYVSVLGLQ